MAVAVYTPRINNNDDEVRLVALLVKVGDRIRAGQELAEVETEKANFVVEAEAEGLVLSIPPEVGQTIRVGAVLMWVGASAGEPVPDPATVPDTPAVARSGATAKARDLLRQYGLRGEEVPFTGERLTAADVGRYAQQRGLSPAAAAAAEAGWRPGLLAPGVEKPLDVRERAMMRFTLWHRDESVPGYVEMDYDAAAWEKHAADFAAEHRLLTSPLLGLMAHRLARYAAATPRVNSTIRRGQRHQYSEVRLGFTIQSDDTLYIGVLDGAARLEPRAFVAALERLQKRAMQHKLAPEQVQGATVGFTSMARWRVRRHVPILPPFCSLMVAHSLATEEKGVLGATYDHRVLSGADAVAALEYLAAPEPR